MAQDQDGQQINCDGVKDRWHDRHISLDAYAGKTVAFSMLLNDICSAGGRFDMYFNNVAIAGNGTVSTLYSPQFGATYSPVNSSGWPGKASNIRAVAEPNSFAPVPDTHFYLADHLGSTPMELARWAGTYFISFSTLIRRSSRSDALSLLSPALLVCRWVSSAASLSHSLIGEEAAGVMLVL